MTGFADHFSGQAQEYARFRPTYPDSLIDFLATSVPARRLAWDCGTGSGQAAVALASRFDQILATDPSREQLSRAEKHPRVEYRIGRESESGLENASADLVTAAQAAHWFDLPAFYAEVDRVLRPGGLIAVWSYQLLTVSPEIDETLMAFYEGRVGPYWPPERQIVDEGYRSLPFPYERVPAPPMAIETTISRSDLIGYVGTWSAVQRFRQAEGTDPIPEIAAALEGVWPGTESLPARWPLSVLAGRARGRP